MHLQPVSTDTSHSYSTGLTELQCLHPKHLEKSLVPKSFLKYTGHVAMGIQTTQTDHELQATISYLIRKHMKSK